MADPQLAAHRRSLKSFRSALTTKVDYARQLVEYCVGKKATDSLKRSVAVQIDKLHAQYDRTSGQQDLCIQIETDEERQRRYQENKETDTAAYEKAVLDLTQLLHRIDTELRTEAEGVRRERRQEAEQANAAAGNLGARPKIADTLKPKPLSRDAAPTEVTVWKKAFQAYYTASNLRRATKPEQHAYLYSCLDTYLQARLQTRIQDNTTMFETDGEETCMDFLKEEFDLKYPVFARRMDFFKLQQKPNQKFTDFIQELKKRGDEAELKPSIRYDHLLALKYLSACCDEKLREKFLKDEQKTQESFEHIAHQHELGNSYLRAIEKSPNTVANTSGRGRKTAPRGRPQATRRNYNVNTRKQNFRGKPTQNGKSQECFRCGDRVQNMNWREHRKNCKGRNIRCAKCKVVGHFAKYCRKGKNKANQAIEKTTEQVEGDQEYEDWDESDTEYEQVEVNTVRVNNVSA